MIRRLAAATALALGLVPVLGAPASAQSRLELSPDGQTWGTGLSAPVLPETVVLVPGEQTGGAFWVRNASTESARLMITVPGVESTLPVGVDPGDDFQVTVGPEGEGYPADQLRGCTLVWWGDLGPHEELEIPVTVALLWESDNISQRSAVSVPLRVSLLGSTAIDPAPDCDGVAPPAPTDPPAPTEPAPTDPPDPTEPGEPTTPPSPTSPPAPTQPQQPTPPGPTAHPQPPTLPERPGRVETDGALTPQAALGFGAPVLLVAAALWWLAGARRRRGNETGHAG